jgi:hypothetical protein
MANRLTDMEFDEVSFVKRGANQKAHVALWKSDAPAPCEPDEIIDSAADLLMDSEPGLTHAQAVAKVYQSCQERYAESVRPRTGSSVGGIAKAELDRRLQSMGQLEEVAKSIRKPGQSHAQAVLAALENDPELYQP